MSHRAPLPRLLVTAAVAGLLTLAFGLASQHSADARVEPDAGAPTRFDALPFSDEVTPAPTLAEWKPATPVAFTAGSKHGCTLYRVREWMKLDCSFTTSTIAELGGTRTGVAVFIAPGANGGDIPGGGELVFPVRRGDRRVFEWSAFGDSYEGIGSPELSFALSESWMPDEPGPTLLLR